MIIPLKGRVEGGSIRLEAKVRLPDGQRVLVIQLPLVSPPASPSAAVEDEDVRFVRATRGQRARQLKAEDGESSG
ncbi:MAG: hypothetical protein HYY16_00260 [Planctomycetes bacterium]|nr:hypothetical protein [Planctomycetota bacterium]